MPWLSGGVMEVALRQFDGSEPVVPNVIFDNLVAFEWQKKHHEIMEKRQLTFFPYSVALDVLSTVDRRRFFGGDQLGKAIQGAIVTHLSR